MNLPELKKTAHIAVNQAIRLGDLSPASKETCAVCGDQARDWHHADYSKPLNVIALCRKCHIKTHRGEPEPATSTLRVRVTPDLMQELNRMAAEYGQPSTSEYVRLMAEYFAEHRPRVLKVLGPEPRSLREREYA